MNAPVDLVYIDPQRRSDRGKGLKYFEDCSPDILEILPTLLEKTRNILIKTSPMLDISQALAQLPNTRTVYVVEWRRECREVLYHLTADTNVKPQIKAVHIDDEGEIIHDISFTRTDEKNAHVQYGLPKTYLYEGGAGFIKAGCYKLLAERYGLTKLHPHTHLYTSARLVKDFPGRVFEIAGLYPVRKKGLPFEQVNLAVRNFPDDVKTLYKRLGLKAGGADMGFACTLCDESKVLIHARFLREADS